MSKTVNMPKVFTSKTQKTGEMGENVATRYWERKGFLIKERNYTKKWGEIDIVAKKGSRLHFVEVKSQSLDLTKNHTWIDSYKPEDNMHFAKIERLKRTLQSYLIERNIKGDWQFDLVVVYLDEANKKAKVKYIDNLIL